MMIIDGEGQILGRVATRVAKELLDGKQVVIVNAEKMIISGREKEITEKWKRRRDLRDLAKPAKNPKYPRRPDQLVKRSIRGMLPWKSSRGREAYKRLKVHLGVPKEFEMSRKVKFEDANMDKLSEMRFITIGKLSQNLGWSNE